MRCAVSRDGIPTAHDPTEVEGKESQPLQRIVDIRPRVDAGIGVIRGLGEDVHGIVPGAFEESRKGADGAIADQAPLGILVLLVKLG